MRTLVLSMVFLVMFLLEVNVIHLFADRAFFDISATVAEVSGYFALWEFFETVITLL